MCLGRVYFLHIVEITTIYYGGHTHIWGQLRHDTGLCGAPGQRGWHLQEHQMNWKLRDRIARVRLRQDVATNAPSDTLCVFGSTWAIFWQLQGIAAAWVIRDGLDKMPTWCASELDLGVGRGGLHILTHQGFQTSMLRGLVEVL